MEENKQQKDTEQKPESQWERLKRMQQQQQQGNQGGQGDNNGNRQPRRNWIMWVYIVIMFALGAIYLYDGKNQQGASKEISYTQLQSYVENDIVESIIVYESNKAEAKIQPDKVGLVFPKQATEAQTKNGEQGNADMRIRTTIPSVEAFNDYLATVNDKRANEEKKAIDVRFEEDKNYWTWILINVVPLLLFVLFFIWMSRGVGGAMGPGGVFGVGKAKAKTNEGDKKNKVTFKDVAGLEGAKQEIQEIVAFLKNPQKYTELGGKIPKGALLVGPPGTGKTLLAKAVAGEADVPFFSMAGSDFVEMFVGVGASRVRDLFRQAAEKAPAIIFIDEIDAIGRARGKNVMSGGNDERESTLNQLLTEMDGFGTNTGVIILAATNRAEILDPALLRAGRFDRQIHVELPDLQERKEIFQVHLRPLKLDETVDLEFLCKQTPGFSGADIANVCNEAALIAARHDKKAVGKQDFMDAVDRIVGGLERKNKIMTIEEKRSIAYHEAGHATVSWMLEGANPLVKVTIVPRGIALGAAWYLPEERQLVSTKHMLDEMCATLAGRAAEEVFLDQTSTGALNDLEKVNKQAYAMVAYYGMSDKLKNICFYDSSGQQSYFGKPYSDETAKQIDAEVAKIINEQMARAKQILEANAEGHHRMAELLIEKEVITSEDVESILGPRPWKSRGDEIIEANQKAEAERLLREREKEAKEEAKQEQTDIQEND